MGAIADPIADMLTRIRNGAKAKFDEVNMPSSGTKVEIARILQEEAYIRGYQVVEDTKQGVLRVMLRYLDEGVPPFSVLRRLSTPGRRRYVQRTGVPRVVGGMGVAILSTCRGVMTDSDARRLQIGGELLCEVY